MGVFTRSRKNENMPTMASRPTTPPATSAPEERLKLVLSPRQRNTPPIFLNTPTVPTLSTFQQRAATLSAFYTDFFTYLESIELFQSHTSVLPEAQAAILSQNIFKGDKLSNNFWLLLRDIINRIRLLYLDGQDPEATLVLGYSDIKIIIRCPYCEDLHEHRRVPDAGIGVPVIYPAGCGAFGRYRVVFPGDIDLLTGTLGKEAVGLQVHKSGAYWMTMTDDVPDLERYFVVKYRPRKSLPVVTKVVAIKEEVRIEVNPALEEEEEEEDRSSTPGPDAKLEVPEEKSQEQMLFEAFQRLDIAEEKSYDPVPMPPPKHLTKIKKLQEIARSCAEKLNRLDQIVGYYSKPKYTVIAERWKEEATIRETRNKVEREIDWQMCTVNEGEQTRLLGLVESDGFRTVCSCIRGPNYPDISVVSGMVEAERLEAHLPLNNKQLMLLVRELAKEIGHEFPKEIPKSASVVWKRELERKNNTASSAEHWHACHAEKKMLVRFLVMHTTWAPDGFSHNIFKYRSLLGKEAGVRSAFCLARGTKFWVSRDVCDDCKKFIEGVQKKFGVYLCFLKMRDQHEPPEPSLEGKKVDAGGSISCHEALNVKGPNEEVTETEYKPVESRVTKAQATTPLLEDSTTCV